MDNNDETITDIPDGGFPPIIPCELFNKLKNNNKTKREFKSNTQSVSIKNILEKRRQQQSAVPFI